MKMPEKLDAATLAPCGMACTVCYKHCLSKKPCMGCRAGDGGKPAHCRSCAIKACAQESGAAHCWDCGKYPCVRIQRLEKSYRARYGVSLVENGRIAREQGVECLLAGQRERWACPLCGGVISLHDRICSDCGESFPR